LSTIDFVDFAGRPVGSRWRSFRIAEYHEVVHFAERATVLVQQPEVSFARLTLLQTIPEPINLCLRQRHSVWIVASDEKRA
jgi:hypothetical protein